MWKRAVRWSPEDRDASERGKVEKGYPNTVMDEVPSEEAASFSSFSVACFPH